MQLNTACLCLTCLKCPTVLNIILIVQSGKAANFKSFILSENIRKDHVGQKKSC